MPTTTDNTNATDSTTNSTDSTSTDSSTENTTTEKKWVQKTVEEPITNYTDALKFAKLEVNKSKRDNGHTLECKTIGSDKWKTGKWCLVQVPSFDISDYMYLTKVDHSQSADDEWVTGLTFQDYPPSFGSGESNKIGENSDDTSTDSEGSGTESTDSTNTISTTTS
jgi:hypothetical protein